MLCAGELQSGGYVYITNASFMIIYYYVTNYGKGSDLRKGRHP